MKEPADQSGVCIFSTALFPPVEYFVWLVEAQEVWIEAAENFNKQSYRNRLIINTGNGPLSMVVPVKRFHHQKTPITSVGVDYATPWPDQLWRAIYAAYKNTPYFLYYQDEIQAFIYAHHDSLFQMNMKAMDMVKEFLTLDVNCRQTDVFEKSYEHAKDLRYCIHPKRAVTKQIVPYLQPFSDRFEFNPRVSVLDLLFMQGPEGLLTLTESARRDTQS